MDGAGANSSQWSRERMTSWSLTAVDLALVFRCFVAMAVGGLVGMEREHTESGRDFVGGRSLPLVALFGALAQAFFPRLVPVGLVLLGVVATAGYLGRFVTSDTLQVTTVVATLLTYLLGALALVSHRGVVLTVVFGALMTVLLAGEEHVRALAERIEREERRATLKFILVAFVVLPLLPNRGLTQVFGLNPQFVWLMVVFVCGLSFLAYLLAKVVGPHRGIGLSGLLGGFVSSTATAVSMAERTRRNGELSEICGLATVVATVAMLPRAVIEVAVIQPSLVPTVALPLAVMSAVGLALTAGQFWRLQTETPEETELTNPFRLRHALSFGAIFAVILVVSQQASTLFGPRAVYLTAVVSGLADVDSITISLAKLARDGVVSAEVATTGIVLAAIANTAVKIGITWVLGTRRLAAVVTVVLGVASAFGLGALVLL